MQNKRRGRIPQSAWPDILKRHNDGETLSSIARDFDCTPSAISYVLKKAANGEATDFDADETHETADTPLLDQPETHDQPDAVTAESATQTQPAQSANAPEITPARREDWRDERRPTMRLPGGERQQGGERPQNYREPRSDMPPREQAPRESGQREQWQPREINRDLANDGRQPRNFDNRGDRPRRDESQSREDNRRDDSRRDDNRRDEPRQRAALGQNAPVEPRLPPQIQPSVPPTLANAGPASPAPTASEYRPSPPFRAVVAEETNDTPVADVDTRIDTGAGELRAAYAAWRKTPSPEALDALQTAVHETRKVLARIEIDIAAARGNDAAPRANFRHTYRAAHR